MTEEKVDSAPEATEEQVEQAQVVEQPVHPRQKALNEIVQATIGRHEADNKAYKENFQEVDEEGKPIQAAPPAEVPAVESPQAEVAAEATPSPEIEAVPPATPGESESFDPAKEYELLVDGHKVMVRGDKILDMGRRSIQKEAAADLRLRLASRILEEAQAKARGTSEAAPKPAPAQEVIEPLNEAQLAEALQFGTREQAAEAIKKLSARQGSQVTPEQVLGFVKQNVQREVANELEFNEAAKHINSEYADLLGNHYYKQMFFSEENRLRREGDQRPYKELYSAIGEDMRKVLGLKKPAAVPTTPKTMAERKQEKASSTPPVPRTAAARLDAPATPKVPTQLDVLNAIRAARKQPPLTA